MRKDAVEWHLRHGQSLAQFLTLSWGQEAPIYKAEKFTPGDGVIYIPDLYVHDLKFTEPPCDEYELEQLMSLCFTGDDFINECGGDIELAERLFYYCDWQSPSSALDEVREDYEEDNGFEMPVYETYAPYTDMTFIMKDIEDNSGNLISTECVGWYFGQPDADATKKFNGNLKARF